MFIYIKYMNYYQTNVIYVHKRTIILVKRQVLNWKKNKTKRLWIRAWNDRKDNYRFGIDFVEYIQIVGFKIGNNVTQDDICHPIYVKFENKSVKLMEI
jgi:hypothetical protein